MRAFQTFFILLSFGTFAQDNSIVVGKSYFGSAINEKEICNLIAFTSRPEVNKAVENIVRRSGLKQNFYVMECPNIDNCFAATRNGERLIVYDSRFFSKLNLVGKSEWAALSVLAHEIGHHLQGHTIKGGGSDHTRELEADEFSGFVMYQMGATLQQAQSAINMVTGNHATSSHPGKSNRLKAISTGYYNAKELYPQVPTLPAPVLVSIEAEPVRTTGCIEGNCTEGRGVAVNSKTSERYEGGWYMGRRHGYGREYFADGLLKYVGQFQNGKFHGAGILYFANGDRYEGSFQNGKMHGKNVRYVYNNGDELRVNYTDGQRQGFGILTERDGSQKQFFYK